MLTNKWLQLAIDVQKMNRRDEASLISEYTAPQVRQAIVHAREDITMIAVHLSSVNSQLDEIKTLLRWVLVVLIVLTVIIGWRCI